jgi:pimeloyl-ACP methyl ester carboxylesterase
MKLTSKQHWFQIIENEEFAHYDTANHTLLPNLPTQFTPTTPALKYPTRHIKTDLHLYCGERDSISDLAYLKNHLPEHAQMHTIEEYEHMDFLWAECAKEKLYTKIVDQLKRDFEC